NGAVSELGGASGAAGVCGALRMDEAGIWPGPFDWGWRALRAAIVGLWAGRGCVGRDGGREPAAGKLGGVPRRILPRARAWGIWGRHWADDFAVGLVHQSGDCGCGPRLDGRMGAVEVQDHADAGD